MCIKLLISKSLDMQHYTLHFVAEDTEPQRLRNLFQVTRPASGWAALRAAPAGRASSLSPVTRPRCVLLLLDKRRWDALVYQARAGRGAEARLPAGPFVSGSACPAFCSRGQLSFFSSPGLRLPASLSQCFSRPGSKSAPPARAVENADAWLRSNPALS